MILWNTMRLAAIIRHNIVWTMLEGRDEARWPAHMAVIKAVYGY